MCLGTDSTTRRNILKYETNHFIFTTTTTNGLNSTNDLNDGEQQPV
jgi:hypothetical protein